MIIPYKKSSFSLETMKDIPKQPGIYRMIDKDGIVMYVGKSKSLNSRVRSYFTKTHESEKLNRMVMFVDTIEIYQTETHLDAMLLEVELIKEIRPLYNSQFKKSDNYSYLDFSTGKVVSISNSKPKGRNLGPFRNSEYLEHFKSFVDKVSPLENPLIFNVIPKRLDDKDVIDTQDKLFEIMQSEKLLGEFTELIKVLMGECGERLEFESASFLKFTLTVLEYLARTTLGSKELIYYDSVGDRVKAYKISEYTVIGVNYFDAVEDIIDEFEEIKDDNGEKDILDHQLVVYHELRKNEERIKKIDRK